MIFSDTVLRFLFEHLIESGKLHEMLDTDHTMAKNKDMYKEAIQTFRESFEWGKYTKLNLYHLRAHLT